MNWNINFERAIARMNYENNNTRLTLNLIPRF